MPAPSAPRRPRPAPVYGGAAWVLVTFLRRQRLHDWLPGVLPNLSAGEREQLLEALFDLEQLAEEHKVWRASEVGSAEVPSPEVAGQSPHEITAREAAGVLRLSDRRVRQLCASGALDAHRDGLVWLIDRSSVELYQGRGVA